MKALFVCLALFCGAAKAKLYHPKDEDFCKALTLSHESRGESLEGARAVLSVLDNRSRIDNMTACEVMTAKGQFSWYNPKRKYVVTSEDWTRYEDVCIMPAKLPTTVYYFRVGKRKIKWLGRYWGRIGRHIFFHKEK